jgi:ribosomal protein S18 acetylase RimI-like enzyme
MTIEAGPHELFTTRAKPADIGAIVELVNSAYRGDSSRRGWTTEADLIDGTRIDAAGLATVLATPGSAVLVMRAQSGLLGCVQLEQHAPDTAYIGMLTIRPALQASGLGRQLLAAAETFARRELGARHAEMTVISVREELLAWYERRGYVATGETRPFPYNDPAHGVPKDPGLEMVVLRKALAP